MITWSFCHRAQSFYHTAKAMLITSNSCHSSIEWSSRIIPITDPTLTTMLNI